MKRGKLKQNGVHLEDHEYRTVDLLLGKGYDVELIPRSQIKGLHLPDISINGVLWEIKAPEGKTRNTIKHNLQNSEKQSTNVIIDLFRCGLPDKESLKELEHRFNLSKRLRRMMVITKDRELLDFTK